MKIIKQMLIAVATLLFSATASAYDFEVDGFYYNIISLSDLTVEVTAGDNKYSGELIIPSTVTYKSKTLTVTSIRNKAFYNCYALTSVTIPNSVTSIGDVAFSGCSGLTSVTIGFGVTIIGSEAFYGCSNLKKVINFSGLTFSKGSSSYGYVAYYANRVITAPNGFIDGDYVWGVNNGYILAGYLGNETELVLPQNCNGESYAIGTGIFENNTALTSIEIPNGVTSIGDKAFFLCSGLTSVTIGNSVTSIGSSAFYNCSGLTSITIPNSVTSIGNGAFNGCSGLTSITIPNSVTSIGDYAFYNCSGLMNITIPNSVTSIGNYAFRYCSGLASVTIGSGVASVGSIAFYNCSNLKKVINFSGLTFSKGLSSYGYVAYYADKVINAPNGFIDGDYVWGVNNGYILAGYLGNETELVLPQNCNGESYAIGTGAFENNTALTSIEIPNGVTSIGDYAFSGCSGLTSIHLKGAIPPSVDNDNFTNSHFINTTVYIPKGSLETYQSTDVWKDFWDIQEYDATGINDINANNITIKMTANGILLPDAKNKNISIYSTNGALIKEIITYTGEEIPLIKNGIYIINIDNITTKVKL